jgi:hypothetical protein
VLGRVDSGLERGSVHWQAGWVWIAGQRKARKLLKRRDPQKTCHRRGDDVEIPGNPDSENVAPAAILGSPSSL